MSSLSENIIIANQYNENELIEQWFDARLSGNRPLASSLAQNIAVLPKTDRTKILHARVAPAAGVQDLCAVSLGQAPRFGNTGGTSDGDITDRLSAHRHCDEFIDSVAGADNLSKVDWLSVSFTAATGEQEQGQLWNELTYLLGDYSIDVKARSKGLHGYSHSAMLTVSGGMGDDINCGMLAWSDKQGLFLELSGKGCDFMRSGFADLYRLIVVNAGRISRCDVALDLDNRYCLDKKITVPALGAAAYRGEYRSKYTPAGVRQSLKNEGDWSDILYGGITPELYDPYSNAPNGLTQYVGSVKSDNQIVFYEKGKQLLGAVDDADYLEYKALLATGRNKKRLLQILEQNNCDLTYEGEKAWVRVERRFRRGSNKKWLAPEMLLCPDAAFIQDYEGLERMLSEYAAWLGAAGVSVVDFSKRVTIIEKSILLTRKMHWAKVAYGRLLKTLDQVGLSAAQIFDALVRGSGLKDYIHDLAF